jgi:hypothetical protein
MTKNKQWYEIARDENILQGELLYNCPIIMPPSNYRDLRKVKSDILEYDIVVMSQSCDLILKKIDLVLLSPFYPLSEVADKYQFLNDNKGKEHLRRGNVPGYHLLNKCYIEGFENDFLIVDFRSTFSLPINIVLEFVKEQKERKRLLPPYREHLSQAFARFFMRVGLPIDIPQFAEL